MEAVHVVCQRIWGAGLQGALAEVIFLPQVGNPLAEEKKIKGQANKAHNVPVGIGFQIAEFRGWRWCPLFLSLLSWGRMK